MTVIYRDGEPCPHRGCKKHITHPCEGCGRIAAQGEAKIKTLLELIIEESATCDIGAPDKYERRRKS